MSSESTASANLFRSLKLVTKNGIDCQGMISHILQCVIALNCVLKSQQSPLQTTYNVLLQEALLFISNELFNDGEHDSMIQDVLPSINDKLVESVWSPIRWAVLLYYKVGVKVVQDIYDADPLALGSRSDKLVTSNSCNLSPAHILCASKQSSSRELKHFLINDFIIRNPKAFTVDSTDGLGVLHILAKYSNEMNLLQTIIQLAPDEVSTKYKGKSPLDILMRDRFLESKEWYEMVDCLLLIDNNPELVHNAVISCFENINKNYKTYNNTNESGELLRNKALTFIEKLLNNCPTALIYQDDRRMNLLCRLFLLSLPFSCIFGLMKVFVRLNKECVRQLDIVGNLPVHYAAIYGSLSCVSFLIDEYPASVAAVTNGGCNLLHFAILKNLSEELIIYLSKFPELGQQLNSQGLTPLHHYMIYKTNNLSLHLVKILIGSDPQVVKIPTGHQHSKQLPIHLLIFYSHDPFKTVSIKADIFRLFLKLFPAAANIKDATGLTPYDIAAIFRFDSYFLRLLLRAEMSMNPQELYRLNYQARRMALFISSGIAVFGGSTMKADIWRKLWMKHKEILKHVVAFL